jgi:hypothetical protein
LEEETFEKRKFFSDLCSQDDAVKWAAVTAMGIYVSELGENNLEAARNWMRRFMWQLNDESGNVGWGIPEVMGEVMARHKGLALEFAAILVSYIREDGNFLEYEPLQRGALWGIGRLAEVRPEILFPLLIPPYLIPFLNSPDADVRGLSIWVAGLIKAPEAEGPIEKFMRDDTPIRTFRNGIIVTVRIRDFAKEAWDRIQENKVAISKKIDPLP